VRIAIFTEVFTPKIDGIVTRLKHTVRELRVLGHEVIVVAPGPGPASFDDVPIIRLPSAPFPWYPEVSMGMPTADISRELADFDPHIIHAVGPVLAGAWGVRLSRTMRLPLLPSYHTAIPQYTQDFGMGVLRCPSEVWLRRLHNRADVNLCPSTVMVKDARDLGIKRVGLWPKAVDTVRYRPHRATREMRERLTAGHPGERLILYVGRISAEKNLRSLLEPIRRLSNTRLAMVGSGPQLEELKRDFAGTPTVFTARLDHVLINPAHREELSRNALASADGQSWNRATQVVVGHYERACLRAHRKRLTALPPELRADAISFAPAPVTAA